MICPHCNGIGNPETEIKPGRICDVCGGIGEFEDEELEKIRMLKKELRKMEIKNSEIIKKYGLKKQ